MQKKLLATGALLITILLVFIGYFKFVYKSETRTESKDPATIIFNNSNHTQITAEIADEPQEHAQGLMYRKDLPEGEGMLFIFSSESDLTFWMKNTYIPLDIIFLNKEKEIIKIHKNATPLNSEILYPSDGPAQFVIEINGGLTEEWGIKEGQSVIF